MPLINTQTNVQAIDEILEVSGVKNSKTASLEAKLKTNRLDTDSILSGIGDIASNSESDIVRLRALEMASRINPETRIAMNDDKTRQIPIVNIIINDSAAISINPILIPRECS